MAIKVIPFFAGLLMALAWANPASANVWLQFGDETLPCGSSEDAVVAETLMSGTVHPTNNASQLHFIAAKRTGKSACPSIESACKLQAYLVKGDKVLVSSSTSAFACVHFVKANGSATSGLVAASQIDIDGTSRIRLSDRQALGRWVSGNSEISISLGGAGFVMIEGHSEKGPPSHNSGDLGGPAFLSPDGETAAGYEDTHFSGTTAASGDAPADAGCRVRLRYLGSWLVVDDNRLCGGNGVSFSGLYIRARTAKNRL